MYDLTIIAIIMGLHVHKNRSLLFGLDRYKYYIHMRYWFGYNIDLGL